MKLKTAKEILEGFTVWRNQKYPAGYQSDHQKLCELYTEFPESYQFAYQQLCEWYTEYLQEQLDATFQAGFKQGKGLP